MCLCVCVFLCVFVCVFVCVCMCFEICTQQSFVFVLLHSGNSSYYESLSFFLSLYFFLSFPSLILFFLLFKIFSHFNLYPFYTFSSSHQNMFLVIVFHVISSPSLPSSFLISSCSLLFLGVLLTPL